MKIANREIGNDNPCYIVGEIGINHNGSVQTAKELIDVAKFAGCDAVKFQKRTVDVVYSASELSKPRESPFGTNNGDLKRGLEFGFAAYSQIDDYCQQKGITWFASPWDQESVEFLEDFDVPAYKIASASITDSDLVRMVALNKKPIIMSTGMSMKDEIDSAVGQIEKWSNNYLALLACTSTYPCRLEDLNLSRIETIKNYFPECIVGYSGHEVGLWTTLCAVAMGAKIVERHITLDRSMWGSDQAASIEPAGLIRLVREIRDFERAYGDGIIKCLDAELPIRDKLRRVK